MDAFWTGLMAISGWIHGDVAFLALILAISILLAYRSSPAARAHLMAALLTAFLLVWILKPIIAEPRPCWLVTPSAVTCPLDYAMPSMHAAIAFALAFACLRRPAFPILYTGAILVALSRIALGVHTLPEVAAGLAIGMLAVAIADQVVKEGAVMVTGKKRATASSAALRPTHHEGARKLAQVLLGSLVFGLAWIWGAPATVCLLVLVVLAGLFAFYLKMRGVALWLADDLLDLMERPQEPAGFGALTFCMGLILSLTLLPSDLSLVSVLLLTLSDSAAALVGAGQPARWPHNPSKSYAGSAAFLLLAVLPAFYLAGEAGLLMVLIATLIESLPMGVDDNLLIPFSGLAPLLLKLM